MTRTVSTDLRLIRATKRHERVTCRRADVSGKLSPERLGVSLRRDAAPRCETDPVPTVEYGAPS